MGVVSDPVPRTQPLAYQSYAWPIGRPEALLPRVASLEVDLVSLLEQRQTRRDFNVQPSELKLGEFLWLACRNRSSRPSPYGADQESRVAPSAGALHPIHVLLSRSAGPWMRYDPIKHAIVEIPQSEKSAARGRSAANCLVDIKQGVLLGLVAEPGKTAAKYENHESLVWRDAGVVLGYMSVVAEALGLTFCPLGITGQPYLTDYLSDAPQLQGAGLAVLGLA